MLRHFQEHVFYGTALVVTSDICLKLIQYYFYRSSYTEVLCTKSVLKNFAKFTGKHLCKSLFVNKVAGLELFAKIVNGWKPLTIFTKSSRPATLLTKRLLHRCFPVNFAKFLRTSFFYRTPPVAASVFSNLTPCNHLWISRMHTELWWVESPQRENWYRWDNHLCYRDNNPCVLNVT